VRVLHVVGTRPQAVKAGPVSRALRAAGHEEVLLHTGQHYDAALSGVLEDEAGLPPTARRLHVGSDTHARQAAAGARGVAAILDEVRPDAVLVAGDTNSALAAALGARAAGVPFVHGEAGVRSGDLGMPEEANRIAADHLADLLLAPTARAAASLRAEGPRGEVVDAGDPLLDALDAPEPAPGERYLATVHRPETTDDPARLLAVLGALAALPLPVDLPLHPRTRAALDRAGYRPPAGVRLCEPLPRRELLALVAGARAVLTDSGGLQREAYWLGVPCVVLRETTEWRETVEGGWAVLAGVDPARILAAAKDPPRGPRPPDRAAFGAGRAAARWVRALEGAFG